MRIILFIFLLWCSSITHAAQITYSFSGVLDRIQDDFSFLNGEFSIGDSFNGLFTYLTGVPELSTTIGDPTTAIYSSIISLHWQQV